MTSTLGFALLGLLAREPRSGYDIAAQLQHRVGPFWHARHSQIYPELARLEADGLVEYQVVQQRDRPAKKVYSVTQAGVDALGAWLDSPLPPDVVRDELTLRAYSIWLADPARVAPLLRDRERHHRELLAQYEEFERNSRASRHLDDPRSPDFATYATLRRGIGYERELADWCGWLAGELERAI